MKMLYFFLFISLSFSAYAKRVPDSLFLPEPTGIYKVGTTVLYVEDTSRPEIFTRKKGDVRQLMIKVWYPARKADTSITASYLPGYDCRTLKRNYIWMNATKKYFRTVRDIPTHSYWNSPVAATEDKFPVVIFSHGYGFGTAEFYHSLMENLASQGYVVLAIIHPYESVMIDYPDGSSTKNKNYFNLIRFNNELLGYRRKARRCEKNEERIRVIHYIENTSEFILGSHSIWVADTRFVLDMLPEVNDAEGSILRGKLDIEKVAAVGHSFGGSVTGQVCSEDNRLKAGINLDGWQYGDVFDEGVQCPFLLIKAEINDWYDLFYSHSKQKYYSVYIPGAKHFTFSDMSVIPGIPDKRKTSLLSSTDGLPNLNKTNELIVDFLNHFLKKKPLSPEISENCRNCGMKQAEKTTVKPSL
ncbi:MAG: hypothetical protein KJ607_04780 [Bacteroidetes bacterium]|nr:hypothetical protein [Bacteroidota bacterium]